MQKNVGGSESCEARGLRANPGSRANPESRANRNRKERGRGLGREISEPLTEPLPRNFLEFRTSNRSIWCRL